MRILILSSVHPKLVHEKAAFKVLAELLENIAGFGHQVSWATLYSYNNLDKETEISLKNSGIYYFGDFSNQAELEPKSYSKLLHNIRALRKCLIPFKNDDYPHFKDPEAVVNRLKSSKADVFLLFWDTWFENLLPYIKGIPVVGYLAKPRYDSSMARLKSGLGGSKVKRLLLLKLAQYQRKRHLQRLRHISKLSNICAVDAAKYQANGIDCQYISNTWPDAFGENWQKKREAEEKKHSKIEILANIGSLSATGNSYGLLFLAQQLLPIIDSSLAGIDWQINICGGGQLRPDLAPRLKKLKEHPRINIKGFVPNIDKEMLSNHIFLLLNNAGPFSGGYTRVVYAFSSGACLVAHKNLAKSMPEVKHQENALLGESPKEIVEFLSRAGKNPELRKELGRKARQTYSQFFRPDIVAKKLINLCQEAILKKNG